MLYYGCRYKNEDFLYREEVEEFEKTGVLTALNVAFSRDQAEKVAHMLGYHNQNIPLKYL